MKLIAEQADAIAAEAMARMYRDPFWEARFGDRGRVFAREDGLHHLGYLGAALEADDPGVLERYAVWLRSVLVARGMCSLQIVENFARIAELLAARGLDQDGRAQRFLRAAGAALAYREGPAAFDAAAVAREALAGPPATTGASPRELELLLAYLADSLAAARPELFQRHLAWAEPYLAARGTSLPALLATLRAPLARASPGAARLLDGTPCPPSS